MTTPPVAMFNTLLAILPVETARRDGTEVRAKYEIVRYSVPVRVNEKRHTFTDRFEVGAKV